MRSLGRLSRVLAVVSAGLDYSESPDPQVQVHGRVAYSTAPPTVHTREPRPRDAQCVFLNSLREMKDSVRQMNPQIDTFSYAFHKARHDAL